jgi:guanylate kinase
MEGEMKKKSGHIIVISAPSGAGKTSICNEIIKSDKNTVSSISWTTRKPRANETDGIEYFFVLPKSFWNKVKKKGFVEWAKVHGNYYGTPKSFLSKTIQSGKNVLLELDVQGGMKIKKQFPDACLIFISIANFKILRQRLVSRAQDSAENIKMRLARAKKEMEFIKKYDFLVVNDKLDITVKAVETIIESLQYKV